MTLSKWYLVKLELGPTGEFPMGSPAKAFLLRLPLARDGTVDEITRAAAPRDAFARRFWENEADSSGAVLRNSSGWNLTFPAEKGDFRYHLADAPIRPGALLELAGPDGQSLPFRVVSIRPG